MNIKLSNLRGDDDYLQLLLTADQPGTAPTGLPYDVSTKWSDFKAANPALTLNIDHAVTARLYIGYGDLPIGNGAQPAPDSDQYYGWIEFTKDPGQNEVWINLTNVDMVGLPLAVSGTDLQDNAFTLGYKKSTKTIISDLETNVLVRGANAAAVITCALALGKSTSKVVGPNIIPESYPSYDDDNGYLTALLKAEAELTILSDAPVMGESGVLFTGSFREATESDQSVISLTDENGKSFKVMKDQFTTSIIYKGDGGKLVYDGTTYDQNRTPANDSDSTQAQRNVTNSVFRNLVIGMNEGYFTTDGDNNSINFTYEKPFENDMGSMYAKVLHDSSNSYGFPYADSNLKTLVQASPDHDFTLSILGDDQIFGYDDDSESSENKPGIGQYQFGIGGGSSDLGEVTIGNCRYLPDPTSGAYGGFLPSLNEWVQLHFSGPDKYIWIKTSGDGSVSADGCLLVSGGAFTPVFNSNKVLEIGANCTWNGDTPSPDKPSS